MKTNESAIEDRVEELVSKMTVEEKAGQTVQFYNEDLDKAKARIREGRVGSFIFVGKVGKRRDIVSVSNGLQEIAVKESRLGIPLIFGHDVIHGFRTIFPLPLAEAASFDTGIMERTAGAAAREARAGGVNWTFGPMVDIARDPRWGRIAEGAGEDPYLGAAAARARVRGFQGSGNAKGVPFAACAKHYVGYGAAEGGRDYNHSHISPIQLWSVYLPPFRAAVDGGVMSIMSAYMDLNGMPASGHREMLNGILKGKLGFKGFVVTDWSCLKAFMNHGWTGDVKEGARRGIDAGIDMDMGSDTFLEFLAELVKEGAVPMPILDDAVRRILRVKLRLDLFEDPFTDPALEQKVMLCPEHLELAEEAARDSFVLLKNMDNLLPLSADIRKIAVVGPLADARAEQLGCWSCQGNPADAVTVLDGIRNRAPKGTEVLYARGCDIHEGTDEGFGEAVSVAKTADVVVLVVGERAWDSGEGANRAHLDLPGRQPELAKAIHAAGKPVVAVLMNGRPLALPWMAENIPAILEAWFPGTRGGPAVAATLFGDSNPSGKLPATFPHSVGQVPIPYNHGATHMEKSTGYKDCPATPLYPFGHGLSYTTFEYSDLKTEPMTIQNRPGAKASVTVKNAGQRAGSEVVQLYIRDMVSSRIRPVKELKGFRKVALEPGESITVVFELGPEALGFHDETGQFIVEPGEFRVYAGTSSADCLEASFTL